VRPVLRIAVVGCGQIADAHLHVLAGAQCARVVAVSDCSIDLARQAAVRFGIPAAFDDLPAMLASASPDVVHVTTPPDFHFPVAQACLTAGAHVYVEKPFTSALTEALALVAEAEKRGLSVCVGEDQLFDPAWEECRSIVQHGGIGDVVHVESTQTYDLNGPFGSRAAEAGHWVHRLRGGLLRNVVPHALARAADFIPDAAPDIRAVAFAASPATPFPSELRVLITGRRTSGSICFSSAARPIQNSVQLFGTGGTLRVDLDARTISRVTPAAWPGALARIELPFRRMIEAAGQLRQNVSRLRRFELHYFEGMRRLFDRFHQSILTGSPPPISHAQAVHMAALLDEVMRACERSRGEALHEDTPTAASVPALSRAS
jgi:predicted dehydrogenase